MSTHTFLGAVLTGGVVGILSCGGDSISQPHDLSVLENRGTGGGSVEFDWHAGDEFLEMAGFPGPDIAQAANGETMEITGTGTLTIHPKSISGGGTFVHKDPDGNVLGSGTWTATRLQSFQSYGPSPDLPPEFFAGKAIMKIVLEPDGSGLEIPGTLWVGCILPGGEEDDPNGAFEGVKLTFNGGRAFTRIPSFSPTLFLLQ